MSLAGSVERFLKAQKKCKAFASTFSRMRSVSGKWAELGMTSYRHVSMCACLLNCFRNVWLCATLWTIAHQAPLSIGFSREEGVARPSTSTISPSTDRSPEGPRSRGASSLAQGKVLLSFPIPNSNSHSPLKGQFPESKTSFSLEELGAQSDYLTSQMIYR